uniref:Uncharacterized protein n=1 Tax=Panagrolaimus davidi TaxID=227884 RepID=A0A914Q671_9BILA
MVPSSHFQVKRTVNSSGVSKYYYGDQTMSRDELRNRLREHGIDMDHNRFLILQGEVESISTMKPKGEKENEKGLLEYLDDIIGTSRLNDKVIDLEKKVNAVDALRQKQLMKFEIFDSFPSLTLLAF